jgi:hypothetical protein
MFEKIEIHFEITKNGKTKKRRAIILPGSGVTAIRLKGGTSTKEGPPDEKDVLIESDTPGDKVERMDAGGDVCYDIGEERFCW